MLRKLIVLLSGICCESEILSKRPILVFCANVAYWCVRVITGNARLLLWIQILQFCLH